MWEYHLEHFSQIQHCRVPDWAQTPSCAHTDHSLLPLPRKEPSPLGFGGGRSLEPSCGSTTWSTPSRASPIKLSSLQNPEPGTNFPVHSIVPSQGLALQTRANPTPPLDINSDANSLGVLELPYTSKSRWVTGTRALPRLYPKGFLQVLIPEMLVVLANKCRGGENEKLSESEKR